MEAESSTRAQAEPPRKPKQTNGGGKQQGSAKLRGLPRDSPEIRLSKSVTWVLRHGARQEGLALRKDGYARVQDLLNLSKFKAINFEAIQKLVADDKKNRYNLIYESDPDVICPETPVWWIRANQGHSMESVTVEVTPIKSLSDVPSKIAVHGTTIAAWESIKREGLSKMTRNHIHLAQGLPGSGVISGMRNASKIFIYIDMQKALDAGLNFYLSSNGVVLSDGDEAGYIRPQFFQQVTNTKGDVLTDWRQVTTPTTSTEVGAKDESDSALASLKESTENLAI